MQVNGCNHLSCMSEIPGWKVPLVSSSFFKVNRRGSTYQIKFKVNELGLFFQIKTVITRIYPGINKRRRFADHK